MIGVQYDTLESANASQQLIFEAGTWPSGTTSYCEPLQKHGTTQWFIIVNEKHLDLLTPEQTAQLIDIDDSFYPPY